MCGPLPRHSTRSRSATTTSHGFMQCSLFARRLPPACCGCSTFCLCLRPVSVRPLVKTSFSLQNLNPFLSRALSAWPGADQSSGGGGEAAVLGAALAFPAPAPDGTAHPGRALGDGLTDEWAASEAAGRLKTQSPVPSGRKHALTHGGVGLTSCHQAKQRGQLTQVRSSGS